MVDVDIDFTMLTANQAIYACNHDPQQART